MLIFPMQGSTIQWLTITWAAGQGVICSAKEGVLAVKGRLTMLSKLVYRWESACEIQSTKERSFELASSAFSCKFVYCIIDGHHGVAAFISMHWLPRVAPAILVLSWSHTQCRRTKLRQLRKVTSPVNFGPVR